MSKMVVLNGNSAVAEAVRQVKPDVVPVYPFSPSSPILEHIASFIADGTIDSELVNMESSHSTMSTCIGAAAAGGRVFTATSSGGLASMQEPLCIASALRLPIVTALVNRALSPPENLYADHSDAMAERDCGWIQIFSENSQEAYDNTIQAFKIAEHPDIRTPVAVCLDSFVTSHTMENVVIEDGKEIDAFVGKLVPAYSLLDTEHPKTIGSRDLPEHYFEHRINQLQGIEQSRKIIRDIGRQFGDHFGRYYGFIEPYRLDDAETALVAMGSAAGTAKEAIDTCRKEGKKVGLLKLRIFRPFPFRELREALSGLKAVAVLDRSLTPGSIGGPLFNEIRAAVYDIANRPLIFPYIYGLGGRNTSIEDFSNILETIEVESQKPAEELVQTGVKFINVREEND